MRMVLALALCCVALGSNGCSVYMAAAGDEEPNLSNIRKGPSRGEVELALGQPVSIATQKDGGTVATYEYILGNEPSAGRAVGHAVLDLLTLGGWEIIGTPVEAMNQGDKVKVTVMYDNAGNATQVQSSKA